jgi:hypothetical protein
VNELGILVAPAAVLEIPREPCSEEERAEWVEEIQRGLEQPWVVHALRVAADGTAVLVLVAPEFVEWWEHRDSPLSPMFFDADEMAGAEEI